MKAEKFQDLDVWKAAHLLVMQVYSVTKQFPREESFGMTSQMRRAAVSIPANIAEGFKRRGVKDKIHFYNISQSSLAEVEYYFILASDLGYLGAQKNQSELIEKVGRMLNALIRSMERS